MLPDILDALIPLKIKMAPLLLMAYSSGGGIGVGDVEMVVMETVLVETVSETTPTPVVVATPMLVLKTTPMLMTTPMLVLVIVSMLATTASLVV